MVQIKDEEGSRFDAPIDVVWKYIQAPDEHGQAHRATRNRTMKPLTENSVLLTMERNTGGTWAKEVNRLTLAPPLGILIEMLEGPMAGSKMMNVYTPHGDKTEIAVYGDFNSKQIPAAQLEPAVRGFLESAFNEDNAAIKSFTGRK